MNKRYKASFQAQTSRDQPTGVFKKENIPKELRMAEANYWSSKLNDSRSGSKEFFLSLEEIYWLLTLLMW